MLTNSLTSIGTQLISASHLHLFSSSSLPTLLVILTITKGFPPALFFPLMPHFYISYPTVTHVEKFPSISAGVRHSCLTLQICGKASRLGCQVAVRDVGVAFTGA